MWKLSHDENSKRVYTNSETNSQCSQTMCYTDKDGNKWWEFDDLSAIPWTRNLATIKISSLYALGLSKDDLSSHINGLKEILKSSDKEKYEKAFALVLDFETKANNATDAIKQIIALVPVYFTMNEEPIDSFEHTIQIKKMSLLELDPEMHNFFLKKRMDAIERYISFLNQLSQIASQPMEELQEVLQ